MTETEAEKKVAEKNVVATERFCPLTKEHCRSDCVCFAPARATESPEGGGKWGVEYGYCANAMFDGVRV